MPNSVFLSALQTTLLAFDEFDSNAEDTGCHAPLAVCRQDDLRILELSANVLTLAIPGGASDEYLSPSDTTSVVKLVGYIQHLSSSADNAGCDEPYTVVTYTHRTYIQNLCDSLKKQLSAEAQQNAIT